MQEAGKARVHLVCEDDDDDGDDADGDEDGDDDDDVVEALCKGGNLVKETNLRKNAAFSGTQIFTRPHFHPTPFSFEPFFTLAHFHLALFSLSPMFTEHCSPCCTFTSSCQKERPKNFWDAILKADGVRFLISPIFPYPIPQVPDIFKIINFTQKLSARTFLFICNIFSIDYR